MFVTDVTVIMCVTYVTGIMFVTDVTRIVFITDVTGIVLHMLLVFCLDMNEIENRMCHLTITGVIFYDFEPGNIKTDPPVTGIIVRAM